MPTKALQYFSNVLFADISEWLEFCAINSQINITYPCRSTLNNYDYRLPLYPSRQPFPRVVHLQSSNLTILSWSRHSLYTRTGRKTARLPAPKSGRLVIGFGPCYLRIRRSIGRFGVSNTSLQGGCWILPWAETPMVWSCLGSVLGCGLIVKKNIYIDGEPEPIRKPFEPGAHSDSHRCHTFATLEKTCPPTGVCPIRSHQAIYVSPASTIPSESLLV